MAELAEDEFYLENGLMVFTERYHLRRGVCCGSGCRHCPYDHEQVPSDRKAQLAPPRPYFTVMVLLLLALAVLARAQDRLELYVRNRPFDGPVRNVGGDLYAPLDDLLRALGCGWEQDDAAIQVHVGTPSADPRLDRQLPVLVAGRRVDLGAGLYQGRLYCSVRSLARVLNAEFRVNPGLGTADLYAPAALPLGESADRPVVKAGEQGSAVEVGPLSFAMTRDPDRADLQYLRGYVVITNKGSETVEGLNVKVEVQDPEGKVVGRFGENLGKLPAGRHITYQFPAWPGPAGTSLKPRVEVFYLR